MPDQRTPSAPPPGPPKDDLQLLLGPIQDMNPEEVHLGPCSPEHMPVDELLQWDRDGVPHWWPPNRPKDDGPPWSPQERRNVLLRNLREQLRHVRASFQSPRTLADRQQVVVALLVVEEGLRTGVPGILRSS